MKVTALPVFFILVITSLTFSCKKKEIKPEETSTSACDTTFVNNYINDTIFPSEYLMTYPGSEWNYDDNSTVICDQWENVALTATTTSGNCVTITKDYHFLPHCSSQPYYIAYNKEINLYNPFKTYILPMLDTVVGIFYHYEYDYSTGPYNHVSGENEFTVIEKLDSMEVLSVTYPDVIHVLRHLEGNDHTGHHTSYYHYYYAKNVGLIKQTFSPYSQNAIISEKNLVSYTIGPH